MYSIIRSSVLSTVNLVAQNIHPNAQNLAINLLLSKTHVFQESSPADILKEQITNIY